MAVNFSEPIKRSGEEWAPYPEQLVIAPELNGRHESPDIEPLIQSILELGQLQLCLTRREGGKMVLAAGFNRWRAVSEINRRKLTPEPLRLKCVYRELNEKQAFLANIAENHVRNATTPMDDAYNIQRLINVYQMSKDEVSKTYGMSLSWVVGRLDLIEATPAVEAQIRKGTIKGPAARTIAKLSKEQQSNLAKIAEEKGKVTPADIRREVGAPEKPATPSAAPTGQQGGIPSTAKPEFFNLAVQFIRAYLSDPQELTPSDLDKLGLDALHAAGLKI
jgi:ParB/RepB/Spo0J family partition protein